MELPKKVAFYISSLRHGGAERVITNLAEQFSKSGIDVILITSISSDDEYSVSDSVRRVVLDNKKHATKISRNISRIFALRRILKKEKVECLISFLAEPNYRAVISTIGLKIKTIISVRNDPKKEYSGKIGAFLARFLLPMADGCVFQTEDAKAWFVDKLQNKSVIISNAVSDRFYGVDWMPRQGNIVAVGRLADQKNYNLMISAFKRLHKDHPECVLRIYGRGEREKDIKKLIEELGLDDAVKLMGASDDVPSVLQTAQMFVMSSDYEGMPNALMEALAVGVPSISTDCPCGGPRMLINDGENGYLVPCNDEESLYIAMKKLCDDNELTKRFHSNSLLFAKDFHETKILSKWIDYVCKVIGEKR